MKLTIKTLKKTAAFDIEIDASKTVAEMKTVIDITKGDGTFPADRLKLIYQGKILDDTKTLTDYNIKDSTFIVCMVSKASSKPKPVAAPAPAPVAAPAVAAPAVPATPVRSASAESDPVVPAAPVRSAAVPAPAAAGMGAEFEANVRNLMDMGFPEAECVAALRAAYMNPARAVEYLMSGIPDHVRAATSGPAAPAAGLDAAPVAASVSSSSDPLDALRAMPNFESMRARVRANPAELATVLREIGGVNPGLLASINTNQAAFVRLMNEAPSAPTAAPGMGGMGAMGGMGMPGAGAGGMPDGAMLARMLASLGPEEQAALATQMGISPEQLRGFAQLMNTMPPEALSQILGGAGAGAGGMPGGMPGGGMGGADPPGVVRIELSEEERAAVERLCNLGFDRNRVLEAYLACDKNEEWTANFLFDNME